MHKHTHAHMHTNKDTYTYMLKHSNTHTLTNTSLNTQTIHTHTHKNTYTHTHWHTVPQHTLTHTNTHILAAPGRLRMYFTHNYVQKHDGNQACKLSVLPVLSLMSREGNTREEQEKKIWQPTSPQFGLLFITQQNALTLFCRCSEGRLTAQTKPLIYFILILKRQLIIILLIRLIHSFPVLLS